ncbi:MAG: hypothetical protein FJZ63_06355 [Chlamydiae bacterium]|nr:hypothetical protein [Chlamydiota bacterium]
MANPVEPVGAMESESNQNLGSFTPSLFANPSMPAPSYEPRWVQALKTPHAASIYSCYMLILLAVNNLGMGNIDGTAVAESDLMNTEQAIQQNLVTIATFLSEIQQNATTSDAYETIADKGGQLYNLTDPNFYNGLAQTFYKLNSNGSDFGSEDPSQQYQTSMQQFLQAFKEIFYCNTNSKAPTVASLGEIDNPNIFQGGQAFNLNTPTTPGSDQSFWQQVNQTYTNAGYNIDNKNVVGTNPNDTASLLQQYMYYQAEVTVDTGPIQAVDAADGQIGTLVNFNAPSQTNNGCDPFISQTLQLLSSFDVSESVGRILIPGLGNGYPTQTAVSTQTKVPLLDLMLENKLYDYGSGPYSGQEDPGLYNAFSYMAFNDYWSKNPTGGANSSLGAPQGGPAGWTSNWAWAPYPSTRAIGMQEGDLLPSLTTTVNGIQTNAGASSSDVSVLMQELSANESSYVNIGQNMMQNMAQVLQQLSQNYISS